MATTTTTNDRLIRPSDYGDLASLRKAFSAAYAESLRHPERELIVVEGGSPEQQAVIASVKAERDRDARRGERSFILEVNTRGKPCTLKRHFGPGCIRQIIGFAEKLAVNDPDRFIWIKNWSKAAKRGRNGESGVYGSTQIKRSVWGLEACQFLVPARKLRNGLVRTGWIVARHDDVAAIDGRKCRLQAAPQFTISPRVWGQRLDEFVGGEIEVRGTVRGTVQSTLGDCLGDCLGDSETTSGGLLNGGKRLGGKEIAAQVVKSVSPNPVNPVKREPSHPRDGRDSIFGYFDGKESTATATSPKSESTPTPFLMTGKAKADSTVEQDSTPPKTKSKADSTRETKDKDYRSKEPPAFHQAVQKSNKSVVAQAPDDAPDLRTCLTEISDGVFEYKYLKSYEHGDELLECCLIALSEPAWRDPAHRMVRAMEMMRDQYGLNVPGGWVQVMRKLRAGGRKAQTQQPQKDQPTDTYQSPRRDLHGEETTAWLERESWDDLHGTYDGFVSSNPAALHRGNVRYRRDKILDHSSNEYLALADELEKLEAEALADDNEPVPY
jgi:hypothetical protein